MSTRHFCLTMVFLALACSSSTEGSQKEFRYGDYSIRGLEIDQIELWEREDGTKFYIQGGFLDCRTDGTQREDNLRWMMVREDYSIESDGWMTLTGVGCELVGESSMRFHYPGSGEVLESSSETMTGRCFTFKKRLPSGETLRDSEKGPNDDPLPLDVVFPDPMPVVTYQELIHCGGWK